MDWNNWFLKSYDLENRGRVSIYSNVSDRNIYAGYPESCSIWYTKLAVYGILQVHCIDGSIPPVYTAAYWISTALRSGWQLTFQCQRPDHNIQRSRSRIRPLCLSQRHHGQDIFARDIRVWFYICPFAAIYCDLILGWGRDFSRLNKTKWIAHLILVKRHSFLNKKMIGLAKQSAAK